MINEALTYEAGGLSMRSVLMIDEKSAGPLPGVLVFPDAFGLGEHVLERAERLAKSGYAALACDIHGEGALHEDFGIVMGLLGVMRDDPQRTRARAIGALKALRARPEVEGSPVAAIGFCFGGTMALELARSGADVAGVVGFHSGLATVSPAQPGSIHGKVLVCVGADDPQIDVEQRNAFEAEMRAARANWQITVYGNAVHAFTNPAVDALGKPEFARYDPQADVRSWAAMRELFDEVFEKRR